MIFAKNGANTGFFTMCERKQNGTKVIDSCLQAKLDEINNSEDFKTLLSCCGHNKYPKTIVVFNTRTGAIFEWFSGIILSYGKRKPFRYYKKDLEGYYFIPETVTIIIKSKYQFR